MTQKITNLEKVLINWSSPIEWVVMFPFIAAGIKAAEKHQKFYDRYGFFKGVYLSKMHDYQRLVKIMSNKGEISDNVKILYDGSPCGNVMRMTCQYFHGKA